MNAILSWARACRRGAQTERPPTSTCMCVGGVKISYGPGRAGNAGAERRDRMVPGRGLNIHREQLEPLARRRDHERNTPRDTGSGPGVSPSVWRYYATLTSRSVTGKPNSL